MFDIQKGRGLMKQRKRAGILLMLVCLIITLALPVTANAAVKINKTSVSVLRGKTYNLKITGTKKKTKWTSSNKKIATVSASGKIKGIKKGRCNIYAKVGKKKYTCKVTVKQPVTSIKLSKKSISLNKGKKYTLKARIAPKNAANKAVVWKSSNTKIASVSSKGVVTAKSAGTTTITATAKDGSRKKASCKVTIKGSSNSNKITNIKFISTKIYESIIPEYARAFMDSQEVPSIPAAEINSVIKTINIDGSSYFYQITPSSAQNAPLSWKSSNTNVATVDKNGNVKLNDIGTTIITASSANGKSASYELIVSGGKNNFMLVDMSKKENIEKYLKRTNRSYMRDTYDPFTDQVIGKEVSTFVYENPLYADGWRCISSSSYGYNPAFEQKLPESFKMTLKNYSGWFIRGNPYQETMGGVDPNEFIKENLVIDRIQGYLVFYNIRGGDIFNTERKLTTDVAYRANPY